MENKGISAWPVFVTFLAGIVAGVFVGVVIGVTAAPDNNKPVVREQTYSDFEWAWNTCTLASARFYSARGFTPEEASQNAILDCTNSVKFYGDPQRFIDYFGPKYGLPIPEEVRP